MLRNSGAAAKRPENVTDLVMQSAALFGADMGIATVITARKMVVIAGHGHAFEDVDRNISFCSHVVADPETVTCVLDASQDIRFAGNPLVRGAPYVRFYAGAPLVGPCGAALGALCAVDTKPRQSVSEHQRQALRDLAVRVTGELLGN